MEIGVYEGASAIALQDALPAFAELHLIDPFGSHADALPAGWGASEWATRRTLARAARRRGREGPRVELHVARSQDFAGGWDRPLDLVFIDGDHSETACRVDWSGWSPHVRPGGQVVFHDARAGRSHGRGLPGPTAVVERLFRGARTPGWQIVAEGDRTVAVRHDVVEDFAKKTDLTQSYGSNDAGRTVPRLAVQPVNSACLRGVTGLTTGQAVWYRRPRHDVKHGRGRDRPRHPAPSYVWEPIDRSTTQA